MAKEDADKPASEETDAPAPKKKTARKKATKSKATSAKKTARSARSNAKTKKAAPVKKKTAASAKPPSVETEEPTGISKTAPSDDVIASKTKGRPSPEPEAPAEPDRKTGAAAAAEPENPPKSVDKPSAFDDSAVEPKPTAPPAAPKSPPPKPPIPETVAAPPPPLEQPSEPIPTFAKYAIAVFLLLVGLVVGASLLNTGKYYLVARDGAVEIWQGRFSPKGSEPLLIMPGVQPPAEIKSVYTRQEVFPLAFSYYLQQAEEVLQTSESPDFDEIKSYLNRALSYATTAEEKAAVNARLKKIDRTLLIFKADVVAAGGSMENLRAARSYLKQAAALGPDAIETEQINQKLAAIEQQLNPPAPPAAEATGPKPAPPAESAKPVKPADVKKSGTPGETPNGKKP
jgi:hypothetical protein